MNNKIIDYFKSIINKKYFLLIVLEDLIMYFNFIISSDTFLNDTRTIVLINNYNEKITIKSIINSYPGIGENYVEKYSIKFINYSNKQFLFDCNGYYYKFNKFNNFNNSL